MSSCYICLESDGVFVADKQCQCKSMTVHVSCFTTWLQSTANPFCCPVCKSDYHGGFMKQFFTEEEILRHGAVEEENDEDDIEFVEERQEHGVPVLFDENNNMYFHKVEHMDFFVNSYKLSVKAQRHNRLYMAKQHAHQVVKRHSFPKTRFQKVRW